MISYTRELRREFHHIAKADSDPVVYEPTMVIFKDNLPGRSFQIPLEAIWKYMDPKDNEDMQTADMEEFRRMVSAAHQRAMVLKARRGLTPVNDFLEWAKIKQDDAELGVVLKALSVAHVVHKAGVFLLCTAFNLAILVQILELSQTPECLLQVFMFIQDGIDELKNMKPLEPEKGQIAGEVTLFEGSTKIGTREVRVTETEMITDGEVG